MTRKKLLLILIFFAAFLVFYALRHKNAWEWTQFHGRGLALKEESLETMLIVSPSIGFIGGHNYFGKDIRAIMTEGDAVIYKTVDSGTTWERNHLGKGVVEQIARVDDQLIVHVRVHTQESFRELRSTLWRSTDNGSTWQLVYESQLPYCIEHILFKNKNNGIAFFCEQHAGRGDSYSEMRFISTTSDGGKTWSNAEYLKDICNTSDTFIYGGGFAYLSCDGNVRVYDCQNGTTSTLADISNLKVPRMTEDESGNLWVIGGNSEEILTLVKIDANRKIITFPISKAIPPNAVIDSLHAQGHSISMTVFADGSILGVNHLYFRSDDSGKTWSKEKVPFPLIVKPIAYLGKNLVWAGKGMGGIQMRTSREATKQNAAE